VIGSDVSIIVDKNKLGDNLVLLNTDALRKQLLGEYIQLDDISLSKRLPHSLILDIKFKKPVARIITDKRIAVIDKNGIVITGYREEFSHLPVLNFGVHDVPDGTVIDKPEVRTSLSFLEQLPSGIAIDEMTIQNGQTLQAKMGKTSIFIDLNTAINPAVSTLQTLLAGFRMKGTMPTSIDLRFDKPIIKY
jgi:cell division septal protein FtsQ